MGNPSIISRNKLLNNLQVKKEISWEIRYLETAQYQHKDMDQWKKKENSEIKSDIYI